MVQYGDELGFKMKVVIRGGGFLDQRYSVYTGPKVAFR